MATPNLPTGPGITDRLSEAIRDPIGSVFAWMRDATYGVLKGTGKVLANIPFLPGPIGK